ncbi:hemolysin family protein [Deinococcus pimensis]|uniref:hemolysin family protein n=1 Tax=Deinococcus pimensis TaxID=309888 RepID=UPI0004817940|nr:hemolysin family protein [Deinococcus pimensis]
MNDVLGLLALFVLVLLNGFFVAAEFALVSVRRTRIDQLVEEGSSSARVAQKAVRNLDLYIAATQLGITMASLGIGFIAEPAIHHLVEGPLENAGLAAGTVTTVSFAIAFGVSTILHIVFGELAPKSIALQRSEQVALAIARPLMIFTAVFRFAIHFLNALGAGVVRMLGLRPVAGHHTAHSEEEIRMIVSASSQEGVLEDDEKELVYNVFDLSDTVVRTIMTPRVDMVMIDATCSVREFLALIAEHGYSRVPVYEERADDIRGVVHTSDVLAHLGDLDGKTVRDIMRPTFFTPESMRVSDLLKAMREKKTHMAIVVDEFGGTAGLVTLEDVLEEIVGEIYDETDDEDVARVTVVGEGEYLLDASLSVDEAEETLGIDLDGDEEVDFETLAGFVTQHFGYIPQPGEHFEWEGWTFRVEAADQRRVTTVRASREARPVPPEAAGSAPGAAEVAYDS